MWWQHAFILKSLLLLFYWTLRMKRLWLMYICFKCSNYFLLIPVILIISDLTCLVMESISLTYRSCSVRTPAHTEHINNYSWRPEGCTVSWYERPHRYCRAAAVCSESRCWFSPPSAPETQREELPVWIGQFGSDTSVTSGYVGFVSHSISSRSLLTFSFSTKST